MPVPSAPPPLEQLGCLPFAFDPAIAGIEPNEWRYAGCTWAEVIVLNARSGQRIGIPRQFVGSASSLDECDTVVSLSKKLEYRAGCVSPAQHRVITMPAARDEIRREASAGPAAVIPIRLDTGRRSRVSRLVWCAIAVGMAGTVLLAYLDRGEIIDSRASLRPPARAAHL